MAFLVSNRLGFEKLGGYTTKNSQDCNSPGFERRYLGSTHVREFTTIPKSGKILLVEFIILGFGIRNTA